MERLTYTELCVLTATNHTAAKKVCDTLNFHKEKEIKEIAEILRSHASPEYVRQFLQRLQLKHLQQPAQAN